MAQTQGQRRASQAVVAWLAEKERNTSWLVRQTGADPGTIGDFLNGNRWPKFKTQGRIEKAIGWEPGSLTAVADGAPPPSPAAAVGGATQDAGYVAAPGVLAEQTVTNEQVLAEVRDMRQAVESRVDVLADRLDSIQGEFREDFQHLSRRVARLESRAESVDGADGKT